MTTGSIETVAVFPNGSAVGVVTKAVVTPERQIRLLPPYLGPPAIHEPYEVNWRGERWSVAGGVLR